MRPPHPPLPSSARSQMLNYRKPKAKARRGCQGARPTRFSHVGGWRWTAAAEREVQIDGRESCLEASNETDK